MKLISLYIENFGGLHRYERSFEAGLTVIQEPNGFGKTTLAEFIRAMFYGFPRKGKTLDKSRRQKYTPWNGGKCGGNLVFEVDGCRYRVERTFGATPKGDTFTLIDLATNKKSDRYSEELGLELFRLDGDSFERSTYLPQKGETAVLTTDSIRSKLTDLVEDANDVGNFEKAVAALKTKRSTFIPYRGSGGSVAQAGSRVTQLQEQLRQTRGLETELETAENRIRELQTRQAQLETEREQVRTDIHRTAEAAAVMAVHQQLHRMEEQQQELEAVCSRIHEAYPAGLPEPDQIRAARDAVSRLEILNSQVVTEQEDLDAAAYLEKNRNRFENRVPQEEALSRCRSWCQQRSELGRQTMELAEKLTRQAPMVKMWPLVLLLLATAGEIALGIALPGQKAVLSYIALGIGAVTLILSVLAAIRLLNARKQLLQFRQEQQAAKSEMERLNLKVEALSEQIGAFLGDYGPTDSGNFYALLVELEHDREDYLRAEIRVAQWQQEKAAHEEKVARCTGALKDFFEGSRLTPAENIGGQLLQIRDDRKDWEEARAELTEVTGEIERFRQENQNLLDRPQQDAMADPVALKEKEAALTRMLTGNGQELLSLQQRRDWLLAQIQQLPELDAQLQQWQEKKLADQKKADLLDDTMALLEQARENLSNSYLGPIQRSFAGYLDRLWEAQEGQTLVTADLEVQLERFGQARELGYFSAGQTDIVMLCMRLALVDALFGAEKPFVILDDPFVNLDDRHTDQALDLLKTLSQEKQIIYLTCSSSRTPN